VTFQDSIEERVITGFTGLYVVSNAGEQAAAIDDIQQLCIRRKWFFGIWDAERGTRVLDDKYGKAVLMPAGNRPGTPPDTRLQQAIAVLQDMNVVRGTDPKDVKYERPAIMVLHNAHGVLPQPLHYQMLYHQIMEGKAVRRQYVIILSAVLAIPPEIKDIVSVIEHELPDSAQLHEIMTAVCEPSELPSDNNVTKAALASMAGLSRFQAEGAIALSLKRARTVQPGILWDEKAAELKKGVPGLSVYKGKESFSKIGGLNFLKQFSKTCLTPRDTDDRKAKGLLLLGLSGVGKSLFAKALGNETGRPTLVLDVGAMMGSLVGQTERQVRQALQIADKMAPAILFCDEVEKSLAGGQASASTDSGVAARLFGEILKWLNDHESDIYFIATCNDMSSMPVEFSRPGRVDAVFFLDLPGTAAKREIWNLHLMNYKHAKTVEEAVKIQLPNDAEWTGAEIENCCHVAKLTGVSVAEFGDMQPRIVDRYHDQLTRLREWASGQCLAAEYSGKYYADRHEAHLNEVLGSHRRRARAG